MKTYKVGDKVTIKKYEDIKNNYPKEMKFGIVGYKCGADGFTENMAKYCGKTFEIMDVFRDGKKYRLSGAGPYFYTPEMFVEECTKEIHITVDGDKTIAVLKENGKVVNRAVAKCNVGDTFDFETGADIALKRVFGNDVKVSDDGKVLLYRKGGVKEVKRRAKVGEYIKIVKPFNSKDIYQAGDILKVYKTYGTFSTNVFCEMEKKLPENTQVLNDNGNIAILQSEYVVLENYEPPKKEESKIKIGDTVEVINAGASYSTYHQWFDKNAPKYASRYPYGSSMKKGETGKVVAIAPHEIYDNTLYAVEKGFLGGVYLIGERGIKKV